MRTNLYPCLTLVLLSMNLMSYGQHYTIPLNKNISKVQTAKSSYTGFQTSSGEPGIENDLANLPFKPLGNSISGDLISCYNAIDLIGKSANLKTKSISGCQIKSSVGTIGNNDNPIIEIVTLRK